MKELVAIVLCLGVSASLSAEEINFDVGESYSLCEADRWKELAESERPRLELWNAIRERALTDEEFSAALKYGTSLNVPSCEPYYEKQKLVELQIAIERQNVLRKIEAEKSRSEDERRRSEQIKERNGEESY